MKFLRRFLQKFSKIPEPIGFIRQIAIVNRTERQLQISYKGPGKLRVPNSGTIEGGMSFPPGKVSKLPEDVVSMEVKDRPSRSGTMDSAQEARWSGKWLKDA